jgi:D-serine deaminase-like pyridoxal phosphate-dependent protein
VVVDAGRKAIGCEYGLPVPVAGDAKPVKVGEEHTILNWSGQPPRLGERVLLRPSNVGMTFYCHDRAWLVRDGLLVESVVTSAARHRRAARFPAHPLGIENGR